MSSQPRIRVFSMEPLTPLMFRIPKPFGYGERAESLPYPQPSTVAGMIRSVIWENLNRSFDIQTLSSDSKFTGVIKTNEGKIISTYGFEWRLIGPYLQKIKGENKGVYYPLPLDVFVYEKDTKREVLMPHRDSMSTLSNLFGEGGTIVDIVTQSNYVRELLGSRIKKPMGFIHQDDMERLLNCKYDGSKMTVRIYYLNEILHIVEEPHIAIDRDKKTVLIREGKGFYFTTRKIRLKKEWRFLFGIITFDSTIEKYFNNLNNKIARFGGESGYVKIREEKNIQLIEHKQIKKWNDEVPKMLRLVFTSPAVFIQNNKDIWYPACLGTPAYHSIRITLIGGWDYITQSPKPLHRGIDMGSVYCYKDVQEFKYEDFIIIRKHIAMNFQGAFGSTLIGIW